MKEEIGKPKFEYKSFAVDHDVYELIEDALLWDRVPAWRPVLCMD